MKRWSVSLLLLTCLLGFASDLPEEEFIDNYSEDNQSYGETYARLTYVGKYINVFHEGHIEEAAVRNLPIVSGDVIEAGNSSFGELEFIDGSLMQFADRSKLEFQAINEIYSNESLTVVRLIEGQLFIHVAENRDFNQDQVFRVDSRAGSAYIEAPGIYMISYRSGKMKLKTYRGLAELSGEYGSELVHSGEFSSIRGMATPVRVIAFNSFRGNAFERWAYDRRPLLNSASRRYVDKNIASYSRDLDDHGEWRYNNEYRSHVWVPYHRSDWRPYHNGYWSPIAGRMTWVSYDPFGYVTHHYGRWGWSLDFGWYWSPGSYYSPAWVAWTTYDSYVGWCPLGYWNRPYYYKQNRYNRVVINNYNNHWNYISIRDVHARRAVRITHRGYRNAVRRITTRPIHLGSDDLRDGRRVARIIRDPKVNRSRVAARVSQRGVLLSNNRLGRQERTRISGRDSGTRASSRYAETTRQVRQQRVRPEGSSLVERSAPRSNRASERQATREGTPKSRSSQARRNTQQSNSRSQATRRNNQERTQTAQPRQNQRTSRTAPPKQRQSTRTAPPKQRQSTRTPPPKQRQSTRTAPPKQRQSTRKPPPKQRQSTRKPPPKQRQSTQKPPPKQRQSTRKPPPKQRQSTQKPPPKQRQSTRTAPPKQRQSTRSAPARQRQTTRSAPPQQRQRANSSSSTNRQRTTRSAPPKRNTSTARTRSAQKPRATNRQQAQRKAPPKSRSSAKRTKPKKDN